MIDLTGRSTVGSLYFPQLCFSIRVAVHNSSRVLCYGIVSLYNRRGISRSLQKSTACRVIRRVSNRLARLPNAVVKFPWKQEEDEIIFPQSRRRPRRDTRDPQKDPRARSIRGSVC